MDGLLRHVCMPKHLKKWLEHTDGAAPEAQLRASLARKWVPFKVEEGHESYVAKRTATKEAGNAKARKVMRSTLMAAISSPGSAVGASNPTGRSTSASGGSSTDGASTSTSPQGFTLPPITPENAAQVGAMIAAMPITHRVIR